MKTKKTPVKIKETIQHIVKNYQPEKVYLFGSYAWGKPNMSSDVDLMIIKKTNLSMGQRMTQADTLVSDSPYPFDILVYTPAEFKKRQNMGDFFINMILKKGALIYEKN